MTEKAYFAAGCFWGVEYYLKTLKGVKRTTVGYCGGHKESPTYEEVCDDVTGHAEAVEVEFDPREVSYQELVKFFFSIHDFEQVDRQGPDVGAQYRTEIFYVDEKQRVIADEVIKILEKKGYKVATRLTNFERFWPAEDYHQDYYEKTGKEPYCHVYRKIF